MYVCVCHGFTEGDVRRAPIAEGGTVSDAYRALHVRPTCGKCVPTVRDMVRPIPGGLTERGAAS